MSNATMHFDSPEEAVRFAKRQGWPFEVGGSYGPCILVGGFFCKARVRVFLWVGGWLLF